jgi:hypothetical protein
MSLLLLLSAWFFDLFGHFRRQQSLLLSLLIKAYDVFSGLKYSLIYSGLDLLMKPISVINEPLSARGYLISWRGDGQGYGTDCRPPAGTLNNWTNSKVCRIGCIYADTPI